MDFIYEVFVVIISIMQMVDNLNTNDTLLRYENHFSILITGMNELTGSFLL